MSFLSFCEQKVFLTKPPEKSLSTSNALSQKKDLGQKRDERGEFIISDLFPISRVCLFPRLRACGFSSMCFWVFGPSDRLALLLLSASVGGVLTRAHGICSGNAQTAH